MKKSFVICLLLILSIRIVAQDTCFIKLWNDTAVIQHISRNIERYRKGDALIKIVDKQGKPVTKAQVVIKQKTHEFLFGCNLFALDQLKTKELNTKYEEGFATLFNFATLPFYWKDLEPQPEQFRFDENSPKIWRRPPPDRLVNWCKNHQITPKGHALMYSKNMFMPSWTESNNPGIFLKQGHKHMSEIAKRYGETIPVWDVANEEIPRSIHQNEWHKLPGHYLSWCFNEANNLFPRNVKLLYNDGTEEVHKKTDQYMALFTELRKNGARVNGMGIQFHLYGRKAMLDGKLYSPEDLFKVYDKLSQLNLPLYITEITIPGNGEKGSIYQKEIVENLYRLWFSTPKMAGITWWNLADGTAFEEENKMMGGLLDEEMNPKPAYQALDKLINHEWKTNIEANTDQKGNIRFKGFHGTYLIEISANGIKKEYPFNLKSGNKLSRATIHLL
jgi:GH35 family endo-1,4-beta-xylanase